MPTILHRLSRWADTDPEAVAQRMNRDGAWRSITTREFRDRVYHLALFLESRGMTREDTGVIIGFNSPEWVHTDLATLLTGARSAGVYPNSTPKDIHYILNHAESRFLAVQNADYFRKVTDAAKGGAPLPERVELVLVFNGDTSISPNAVSYADALAEGRRLAERSGARRLEDFLGALDPHAGQILVYTSGTTGNPKGALLSHDNLVFTSDIAVRAWRLPMAEGSLISFLPLCHVAEKLQCIGVGISQRYTVSFASKFEAVSSEMPQVEPTLLLSVPRLWEKMMEGVMNKVNAATGPRKRLATWALDAGRRVGEARAAGRFPNPADLVQYRLADRLVLRQVRAAMGLGKAEKIASGAAALPAHVSRWFRCLGLEILEDYGQTESTGIICMTEPGVDSSGTVGQPAPGVELRIAEDGELLARGRNVFKGYLKDDPATAIALEGGWLHTGDLAERTERGLIRIRGRKKEILKTSGGKMIAPLPIEENLKAAEVISQVCIVGDGRKFLTALVTLSEEALAEVARRPGAAENGTVKDPEILRRVQAQFDTVNRGLAGFEQIKRFTVLAREFSIVDGEMTPTLKMKRNVIERSFLPLIDAMYAGPGPAGGGGH